MESAHFDRIGTEYDAYIPDHIKKVYFGMRYQILRDILRPGSKVLDLGCGTAMAHQWYMEKGIRMIGIDPSGGLLKIAKKRNNKLSLADGLRLPFKDDAFDGIMINGVLHHIVNNNIIKDIISEAGRVTRPGGWLAVIEHNILCPYLYRELKSSPIDRDDPNVRPVSQFLLKNILKKTAFKFTKLVYYGWIPRLVPAFLVPLFKSYESMITKMPVIKTISAQYIMVGRKDIGSNVS